MTPARRADAFDRALAAVTAVTALVGAAVVAWVVAAGAASLVRAGPSLEGVAPFLATTLVTTAGAALLGGVPALLTGLWVAEFAPRRLVRPARRLFEAAAAVPAVVYGHFVLATLAPRLARAFPSCGGVGVLPASVALAAMAAPSVALLSIDALQRAAPGLREASLALGASRWQTAWRAVVPSARHGLAAALVLGVARASGEAVAVQALLGDGLASPFDVARACPSVAGVALLGPTSSLATRLLADGSRRPLTLRGSPLPAMALLLLAVPVAATLVTRWLSRRRDA